MAETSPHRLEVAAPVFAVTDMAAALDLYTRTLGFELNFAWPQDADAPIAYAILRQDACELHLSATDAARPGSAYFFVDNVAGLHAAALAHRAPITEKLKDQPWNMREFEVTDPDGNRLLFGEHLSRILDSKA